MNYLSKELSLNFDICLIEILPSVRLSGLVLACIGRKYPRGSGNTVFDPFLFILGVFLT